MKIRLQKKIKAKGACYTFQIDELFVKINAKYYMGEEANQYNGFRLKV